MRFLCISDLHLSKKKPIGRLDEDYWKTQQDKLNFIFQTFSNKGCDYYLCGGDVFDRPIIENEIECFLMDNIENGKFITTHGQHDEYARSITDSCSISILEKSGRFILEPKVDNFPFEDIEVYCCGYGEQIPQIDFKNVFNILLIHTMVSDKDYWNGHVKWMSPKWFFRNTKFDLIVSGDNHTSFHYNKGDRWLINSGSMVRKNVLQENHKPCFWIFDTITKKAEQIFIPTKPFSDIMKVDEHIRKKEKEFNDAAWKAELNRTDFDLNVNFKDNLIKEAEKLKDEEIMEIINKECLKD